MKLFAAWISCPAHAESVFFYCQDNRLNQIHGLEHLVELKKLELGSNFLTSLDQLCTLTNLTQLSVEDNLLENLSGLEGLVNLMELYAGNNSISELRVMQQLKDLSKLIILDLLGNPVCKEDEYRLYIIYHLRKLKVLHLGAIHHSHVSIRLRCFADACVGCLPMPCTFC